MRRRLLAEVAGTFGLVFAGTGAIVVNDVTRGALTHVGISLSWGLAVLVLAFAFGPVSGAHFNPVVTLVLAAVRRFPARHIPAFLLAQLAGAFGASLALKGLFPLHPNLGATLPAQSVAVTLGLELFITTLLLTVILASAGHKLAPVFVGATVTLAALFSGPLTGASMNPTRTLAPAVVAGLYPQFWVYFLAPALAAALALFMHRVLLTPAEPETPRQPETPRRKPEPVEFK